MMGGWVENLHTELSATRRDSRGELAMVVVIESYDSQESRSCGSSFPRDSRTEGAAFGSFNSSDSILSTSGTPFLEELESFAVGDSTLLELSI